MADRQLSTERRLDLLEQDTKSHAKSLTDYNLKIDTLLREQAELTEWRIRTEERTLARREEIDGRLKRVEDELGKVQGNWAKIAWTVVGAVLVAAGNWIMRGGLFK